MGKKIICSICEKEIKDNELFDSLNGAVVGKYIEVRGHTTCIHNVNRIVVLENRMRINLFLESLKEEFSKAVEEQKPIEEVDQMLQGILEMTNLINEIEPDKIGKA